MFFIACPQNFCIFCSSGLYSDLFFKNTSIFKADTFVFPTIATSNLSEQVFFLIFPLAIQIFKR